MEQEGDKSNIPYFYSNHTDSSICDIKFKRDTHAPSICQGPTIFLGIGEQPIHSLSRCRLQARRERAGASVAQWRSAEDSVGGARGKAGLQKENTGMPGRGQARKALPAMLKGKI